jgi:hypothetical protein
MAFNNTKKPGQQDKLEKRRGRQASAKNSKIPKGNQNDDREVVFVKKPGGETQVKKMGPASKGRAIEKALLPHVGKEFRAVKPFNALSPGPTRPNSPAISVGSSGSSNATLIEAVAPPPLPLKTKPVFDNEDEFHTGEGRRYRRFGAFWVPEEFLIRADPETGKPVFPVSCGPFASGPQPTVEAKKPWVIPAPRVKAVAPPPPPPVVKLPLKPSGPKVTSKSLYDAARAEMWAERNPRLRRTIGSQWTRWFDEEQAKTSDRPSYSLGDGTFRFVEGKRQIVVPHTTVQVRSISDCVSISQARNEHRFACAQDVISAVGRGRKPHKKAGGPLKPGLPKVKTVAEAKAVLKGRASGKSSGSVVNAEVKKPFTKKEPFCPEKVSSTTVIVLTHVMACETPLPPVDEEEELSFQTGVSQEDLGQPATQGRTRRNSF